MNALQRKLVFWRGDPGDVCGWPKVIYTEEAAWKPRDTGAYGETLMVMKTGRLYDASTLDELWPDARVAPTPGFACDKPAASTEALLP